jgi:anaerobic dimethyl sulfoxide reductase subunit C (anchor subunit)
MRRGGAAKEWPLIGFTLLSQTAVGAFWALAAAEAFFTGERPAFLDGRALIVILVLAGIGTLLSLFHLGKPLRAANALANLRKSWLSREILADLFFIGAGAALWILAAFGKSEGAFRTILIALTSLAGFFLLFTMSRIYMIRTVPVWRGAHTPISFFLSAVFLGPLLAAILTPVFAAEGSQARWAFMAISLVVSGLILMAMALLTPSVGLFIRTQPTLLAYPEKKIIGFLAVRAIALLAAAVCLLFFLLRAKDASPSSLFLIAGGVATLASEIAGRALFYAMYSRLGV